MFKNIFRIILRDLVKDKTYTSISILGLSAGIAVSIIIIVINISFLSYDKFHTKGDRIYQAFLRNDYLEKGVENSTTTPYLLGEVLKSKYPEVADAVTIMTETPLIFIPENNYSGAGEQSGFYADASLFKIFSFPIIASVNKDSAFTDINSIAISKSIAEKYFGNSFNAIGKKISLRRTSDKQEVYVSSVFEDVPYNSSLKFEFVLPLEKAVKEREWLKSWPWGNFIATTYFELKPGINLNEFNGKIKSFITTQNKYNTSELFLYKYEDVFFKPPQGMGFNKSINVVLLFFIAAVIIIIAAINFINLATSRAAKKSKEIGLRKVVGADRKSLIFRFMTETYMLSFASILMGLLIAELLLPYVNNSFNGFITLSIPYNNVYFIISIIGLFIFVGFLSGIYPSLYLSALSPNKIIKGIASSHEKIFLRKSLITLQFVCSALFIFITIVVYKQMKYITGKDLGMNISQVLELSITKDMKSHIKAFQNDLKTNPDILGVTTSSFEPIGIFASTSDPKWEGKPEGMNDMFPILTVADNFLSTFEMKVIKGRDLAEGDSVDNYNVIINEKMARIINKDNPVGLGISFWGENGQIVGVVKDFNFSTLHEQIGPVIIRKDPGQIQYCFVKFYPANLDKVLPFLEKVYTKYEKEYPLKYKFLDEQYINNHLDLKIFVGFFGLFAAIAIVISCLGLFGLTAFNIQQKTKEVGIRKVLGASTGSLSVLLTKTIFKLILIAVLIALPAGYFLSEALLQMFVYKINISSEIFFITVLSVFLLASVTILYQVFRAAAANPVDSLKYE